MTNLIALRAFRYGTRELRAGDTFTVNSGLARFYVAVGRARVCVNGLPAHADGSPAERGMPPVKDTPPMPKLKRRYRRRDMRAEE